MSLDLYFGLVLDASKLADSIGSTSTINRSFWVYSNLPELYDCFRSSRSSSEDDISRWNISSSYICSLSLRIILPFCNYDEAQESILDLEPTSTLFYETSPSIFLLIMIIASITLNWFTC